MEHFIIYTGDRENRVQATPPVPGTDLHQHAARIRRDGLTPIVYSTRDGARIWV